MQQGLGSSENPKSAPGKGEGGSRICFFVKYPLYKKYDEYKKTAKTTVFSSLNPLNSFLVLILHPIPKRAIPETLSLNLEGQNYCIWQGGIKWPNLAVLAIFEPDGYNFDPRRSHGFWC